MTIIETPRIRLEKASKSDAPFILELLNTEGWLTHIGDAEVRNLDDAVNYIARGLEKSYEENGFGLYKMVLKSEEKAIGLCGLIQRDFLPEIDLGFGILPAYERKAYTYEASRGVLKYAFETLGKTKVLGFTSVHNTASQRLLQKLGFVGEGLIKYKKTDEDVSLFGLDEERFIRNLAGEVRAVSKSPTHSFSKKIQPKIKLLKGLGIEGDAHMGKSVKHRSRVRKDPSQPNLRQVHLIHEELLDELKGKGFDIKAGEMGENISTRGVELLKLPQGSLLKIGNEAVIKVTGLRNPCSQLDGLQEGLMKALVYKDTQGKVIRKAGIMGIVEESGWINQGDKIEVVLPSQEHLPLERV